MNTVLLGNTRDVPLTTDLLAFMQSAYTMLEKLTALGGNSYILSGCAVTGLSVGSGWVVINGMLLPFVAGSVQANVRVVQTVNTFNVGAGSETETSYRAEFGTSTNPDENIDWATLNANRINSLLNKVDKEAGKRLITDSEATKLAGLQNYTHPSHVITDIQGLSTALGQKVSLLAKGTHGPFDIDDSLWPGSQVTVSLGTTLPNTNYIVLGTLRSEETTSNRNADIGSFMVCERATTYFKMWFKETDGDVQILYFDYILISLD